MGAIDFFNWSNRNASRDVPGRFATVYTLVQWVELDFQAFSLLKVANSSVHQCGTCRCDPWFDRILLVTAVEFMTMAAHVA